jgi:hypothetical protein
MTSSCTRPLARAFQLGQTLREDPEGAFLEPESRPGAQRARQDDAARSGEERRCDYLVQFGHRGLLPMTASDEDRQRPVRKPGRDVKKSSILDAAPGLRLFRLEDDPIL